MNSCSHCPFATEAVKELQQIKKVMLPAGLKFRQIIVTGPPCSGKSTLVRALGGWPEEGGLDLSQPQWWRSPIFTFRPREIHFNIPFKGVDGAHAVFDSDWIARPAEIDFSRILLPPAKRGLFSTDWRSRYAFNFQLPAPESIYEFARARERKGTHPIDASLTLDVVRRQFLVYAQLAQFFQQNGLIVWVRDRVDGPPLWIVNEESRAVSSGG